MVSEALDGLTDEQLADLELQESGLVSGQNEGAIASTPFAQRTNPQPAPAPEPEEPVALSDYELNQLEEENYRRIDYVMTPQEFDQMWDRRIAEDNEVGRFIQGLGQGAAGLIGMVPEAGREISGALIRGVQDPIGQAKQNIQTGAEIIRKGGINLVQLFDWVSNKYDDLATSSKRAEAINAGIMDSLIADGKMTGDRERDMQIYQAALAEARKSGAYKPTAEQVREDRQTAYQRYVREKSLEREYANVSQFKTGDSAMSSPTTAEGYQITDEKPMETVSQLGAMAIDPVNLIPMGAGALSKARVLRRMAVLSEKPLQGVERAASGLADVAERIETGLSTRIQDITGLTQKQQAALGAGVAGTAVYVDSATESQGGLTKAVMMVGGVLPALHYGGGLLRKVGSAAGGAATVVREAGVGGLGVARAEAAAGLAGNAAIPERYRKFFTGYVDGTDSTLKRVAQNAGNPEALRRVSRFADRVGATQVARVADDAVSGAVTAGIVGTPFAALQPDAERAGEVMGGILALGAAGGVAGGFARRRSPEVADADIARMFADVQAVGGNVEAFARLPHATLDRLAAMQGVLAGKVDFVPLTGDEYRMNADIAQNGGEATAGVFLDRDANNRARVFINLDGKTATDAIAPHEIGHAILTSNVLDGQPRNDLRNLVNQQYGPEGVEARGREYIARMVDADLRQGVTGEAPTVLTEAEMKAMEGGKTMDDIVADRAKDPAERDRLINERMEEFRQRSIDKGEDAMDWARDEIIAETFASEAPAIDFRAIRRDAMFPRLAESMLAAGGRVLEVFGANLSSTGKLMDNPSVLFRDNPIFQDRIMQKRVREYVRSYDQYLAGLEEAGAKELRGVELARSSKPEDLARSTHVKLRNEGRGVLENDFLFQKPDGTYSLKPQKIITATENARSAQIKTLYDARKFVPVNSAEFGKRKVNGREVIGGPVLPPQFDLFTNFPKHVREFARQMERSREEGGSWDIDYNAIGTGASGRYRVTNLGNVRAIQRETVPYGWIVSKANHLLAASLDLNAFRASAMKAINKGDLGLFNNDMRQVEADLKTYLANHRNGMPGEMTIGQQKRDMLNGLIGTGTAVQRAANPLYSDLNPRGSIRTWRVDRLNDAKPTGRTGYFFDYDKINNNRMPSALPQSGMAMPDAPANLSTDQILRELEENQGYLGLSTLGMREGRPVKGGAQQTRELLKRNTALNEELRRRGGPQEESDVERVLRQRGQAMPDVADAVNDASSRLGGKQPRMTTQTAWMTPDGKFLNVGAHGHSAILEGQKQQLSTVDYMRMGFVRLNARESGKLYADARAPLTRSQLSELKNTAIERGLELVIEQPATGGTRGQAMPDVMHSPSYKLSSKVPARGHFLVGAITRDGRKLEYKLDPRAVVQPPVKDIRKYKGEHVMVLEADRYNTLDGRMGGPLHPWLKSNQVIVRTPDGKGYKAGWANMTSTFVSGARNKSVNNTDTGRALIQVMAEDTHRSNRDSVFRYMDKVDAVKPSMTQQQVDSLHVLLELGARMGQKETLPVPQKKFVKAMATVKSQATRGNKSNAEALFKKAMQKHGRSAWFQEIAAKFANISFTDEAARFTFPQRSSAMDKIDGLPFLPSLKDDLAASADFVGAKNLDVVASIQLSQNPDAFAVYFGKNPAEEAKMTATERNLRDQFLANKEFRVHPSYDWMMLSPENADNFILEKPVALETLFPWYRKAHPKASVKNGSPETVAGAMRKYGGIKLKL